MFHSLQHEEMLLSTPKLGQSSSQFKQESSANIPQIDDFNIMSTQETYETSPEQSEVHTKSNQKCKPKLNINIGLVYDTHNCHYEGCKHEPNGSCNANAGSFQGCGALMCHNHGYIHSTS
jgi:hypothetical protein